MQRTTRTITTSLLIGWTASLTFAAQPIPAHPKDIKYPELEFKLPRASRFREVLPNGMVVFIAEDRMLPTFDMSITIRTGGAVEPSGKAGLASLVGEQMRDGGTKNLAPADLDEELDFLAASIRTNIGDTRGRASLRCLAKDTDAALALLVDVLRYPRFDSERLRLAKERMLQNVKRRNDSTQSISQMEWGFLMDGEDHFSNSYPTTESINTITRDDMMAFHHRFIHPGNMIVTVAGDFDRSTMLRTLARAFGDWPVGETGPLTFPKPNHTPKPGVYVIHKDGVNQGRVAIGHTGVVRGSKDEFALQVMNGILGASGFRARLVARVRSDEGLAYNTGSRFGQGVYFPGHFMCWFQSKSNSCAYATQIVVEEIKRLQTEKVSQEDVDATVAYTVESFPQRFQSKMALLGTFAADEYTDRAATYWQSYVDNLKRVTPEDVQRVAKKYLHPDKLVILAVGDSKEIINGGHDKAPNLRLDAFGKATMLPQRNPETMKRE